MPTDDLLEALAAVEHEQWTHWTRHLLDNLTPENIARWRRQCDTPYVELSEDEKEKDREWARRVVLERLWHLLWTFGVANDAQDRDCEAEAERLRRDASVAIRQLMEEHPFIGALLPRLEPDLATRNIEGVGWSLLVDALRKHRKAGGRPDVPGR
jgi:hypothetical protein